ncbi:MAG: DNA-3-methyladenine glycosylase [Marinilabiliaceae bacterium]|nr:DNA-3-methyladenine glycosylase [Marinilabiliaceae bacterium]
MQLNSDFYQQDVISVAKMLLGAILVRQFDDGTQLRLTISEVEAYKGEDDLGCHASKGRTPRTEIMYCQGGKVYVYLIYGMYWLLNVVTGHKDHPEAVLIRGSKEIYGPGKIGKALHLDKSFYGENLCTSKRIWIEKAINKPEKIYELPRVGIDYAGPHWSKVLWRFTTEEEKIRKK